MTRPPSDESRHAMTSPTGTSGSPTADAPQHLLGRFPTYAGAERLVDLLVR